MNKEVQKAIATLNEKEAKSREAIEKAAAEVKATNDKLSELKSALDKASGRDEFIKLSGEIRDNEAALEFCKKKEKEARAGALSAEEYASIKATAKDAFEKAAAEHRKAITAEIDKLAKLITAYDEDADTLRNLLQKAATLANTNDESGIVNAPLFDVLKSSKEGNMLYPNVMHAFMQYKTANIMMQNAAIKGGGAK